MSLFNVTPQTTAHALSILDQVPIAQEQLRAAMADAAQRIAELEQIVADLIHPHDLAQYRAKKEQQNGIR